MDLTGEPNDEDEVDLTADRPSRELFPAPRLRRFGRPGPVSVHSGRVARLPPGPTRPSARTRLYTQHIWAFASSLQPGIRNAL